MTHHYDPDDNDAQAYDDRDAPAIDDDAPSGVFEPIVDRPECRPRHWDQPDPAIDDEEPVATWDERTVA